MPGVSREMEVIKKRLNLLEQAFFESTKTNSPCNFELATARPKGDCGGSESIRIVEFTYLQLGSGAELKIIPNRLQPLHFEGGILQSGS
jgi:hypothetical protein